VNKGAFDSSKLRFPLPLSVMDIDHPIHKFVHRSIVLKKVGVTQSATDHDAKTYSYKYKNQPVIFSVKKGKVFGSVKLTRSESPSVPELGGGRLFLRPCPNTATLTTNNLGSDTLDWSKCHVLIQKQSNRGKSALKRHKRSLKSSQSRRKHLHERR